MSAIPPSMSDRDGKIWMDGQLVNWRDAKVHVLTHTLHYGCGAFEGVRAYNTVNGTAIFRLQEHTERLFNSAKILRMQMPFSKEQINDISELVFLHLRFHGYGSGEWTDSAVRRYVRDAGPLLEHLHVLTRADCTTRNQRKAELLAATYDSLEARITQLKAQEELDAIRPDLDGLAIMRILGIKPSPIVGEAYDYLLEQRLELGPLGEERATEMLLSWWEQRQKQ